MSNHTNEQLDSYFRKQGGYKKMTDREESWSEQMLTNKIATYLREHHPTIPFQIDLSGEALSKTAAVRSSKNRAGLFKMPDLTIYVKKGDYGCLMLELKKLSAHPLKKDGTLKKNEHVELQARSIEWLRAHGQKADFGVGYDDVLNKINEYLTKEDFKYLYKP